MAYSLVYPNKFALKLKIHSKICEKELKDMLLKIQGVHSVKIDEKLGNLIISGTVDPGDDKILEISTSKNVNGGGFCRASSSCCGDHADINRRSHSHCECCRHSGDTSSQHAIPSAPPLPFEYFQAPPSPQSSSSPSMPIISDNLYHELHLPSEELVH